MEPRNELKLAVSDRINDVDIDPSYVSLSLIGEFQKDVADFLRGAGKDVDVRQVIVSIEPGSLAFVATGLLAASGVWNDLGALEHSNSISHIDRKRAEVIARWQSVAKENPTRKYQLVDSAGNTLLSVTADSDFRALEDVWLHAEKYIFGVVTDMGGTTKPNIHIKVNGQTMTVAASQDQLAESEKNRLYREELLHVSAEENSQTGELRHMRLIAFQSYKPKFDEDEFNEMVERGTRAWSSVDDNWLESFRNGDA